MAPLLRRLLTVVTAGSTVNSVLASTFGIRAASAMKLCKATDVSYINSSVAKAIDETLMSTPGFSLDQLMELAGLSVATAVHDFYESSNGGSGGSGQRRVLVLSGPGNNGGDGLVAARHLAHFGYTVHAVYPKRSAGQLFTNLVKQCEDTGVPVTADVPSSSSSSSSSSHAPFGSYDVVVDALFGFSFEGPPREPFAALVAALARSATPVVSVDVPSGWHVERGDIHATGLTPAAVVSLTAPKECMKGYVGRHYVGGRFIPKTVVDMYNLALPAYGGADQVALLDSGTAAAAAARTLDAADDADADAEHRGLDAGSQITALFATASSLEEAQKIARGLLEKKLVACVNMLPQVTSVYTWEGKVEESTEVMMVIKTRRALVAQVTEAVKGLHSYQVQVHFYITHHCARACSRRPSMHGRCRRRSHCRWSAATPTTSTGYGRRPRPSHDGQGRARGRSPFAPREGQAV